MMERMWSVEGTCGKADPRRGGSCPRAVGGDAGGPSTWRLQGGTQDVRPSFAEGEINGDTARVEATEMWEGRKQ